MPQTHTPTVATGTPSATYVATIPALADDANIVTAFEDYHDSVSWYIKDAIKKSDTALQTVGGALTVSGAATITGALVASSTINVTGAATFSANVTVPLLTASTGIVGDIKAPDGTSTVLDNGTTGGTISLSGSTITASNATFYGTSAAARSSILYKATGADYTTIDGVRRIFVGATQPTGPTLQAGDIWMW